MKSVLLITFGPFEPFRKNSGEEAARMMVNTGHNHGRYWLVRECYPGSLNPESDRGLATLDLARRTEADVILIIGMKPRARGFEAVAYQGDIDGEDLEANGSDSPHVLSLLSQMRAAVKARPSMWPDIPWHIAYVPCTPECVPDGEAFLRAGNITATTEQIVSNVEQLLDAVFHQSLASA